MASRLLGGRFFQSESLTDFRPGRISGEISQENFTLLDELLSYTCLSSSEGVVPRVSLNYDPRYTRIIFTSQNITLKSLDLSEYHTDVM